VLDIEEVDYTLGLEAHMSPTGLAEARMKIVAKAGDGVYIHSTCGLSNEDLDHISRGRIEDRHMHWEALVQPAKMSRGHVESRETLWVSSRFV
jgi:hypothetical protein